MFPVSSSCADIKHTLTQAVNTPSLCCVVIKLGAAAVYVSAGMSQQLTPIDVCHAAINEHNMSDRSSLHHLDSVRVFTRCSPDRGRGGSARAA